jgi:hypothetical protein
VLKSARSFRTFAAMVLTGVRADLKLAFCPTQFKNEHAAWKTVIQLNLIRCASV